MRSLVEAFKEFYRCVRVERARDLGEFFMPEKEDPGIHLAGAKFLQPVEDINWEDRLKRMLVIVGSPGRCKGCDMAIYWVSTRRDAVLPYTAEGLPHFADCPKADQFRKKKR